MPTEKQPTWADIKKRLAPMTVRELVDLIRDLHQRSSENRLFLAARLGDEASSTSAKEVYRKKITDQFFPDRGFGKPGLAQARKAIRDYRKATGDVRGAVDLMMTYVEVGAEYTSEYGDIDQAFYNSQMDAMSEVVRIVLASGIKQLHAEVLERMRNVERNTPPIGWGYGDHIGDTVAELLLAAEDDDED